ncbi:hypothetical protein [Calothrix sp. NIES-3974]|uniref:hypothetical protein n=1 Tax=Calothrix sp. NIES-3974 TaxID=2005462 RepID=UPI000B5FF52F|nr:hypothetical protein [Calothrix sp. NIES-3974]BAZ04308.1 hypothetical protein NIES3974_09410 [Calothrix sp. NIES-3974]
METMLEAIKVVFVESANGPEGAGEAFKKLESRLSSLKGRKFYGTFQYPNGPYRACLALEADDDPDLLGLETWMIPGGKYAREKIENWSERLWEIPQVFSVLSQTYQGRVDPDRPRIEFYKSQKELFLLLPIQ